MTALLTRGNAKLGPKVWHFDLPAGPSCPGASEWCALHCYAKRGHFLLDAARTKYVSNLQLVNDDINELQLRLYGEIRALPADAAIRIHTSGDFHTRTYILMWYVLARYNPDVQFYAYTRSWRVPDLVPALEFFRTLDNVTLWASTDETTGPGPDGWPEATIGFRPGYARCPEQTGKRTSCSECRLCWHRNLRPNARLAFRAH